MSEYVDKAIPFGKYKDVLIADCPDHYLLWLTEQDWFCIKFKDLLELIKKELKYRERFNIKI